MLIHAKLKLKLSTPTRFCLGMYFVEEFKVILCKSYGELTTRTFGLFFEVVASKNSKFCFVSFINLN